jgi:hypothetical protein
VQLQAALPSAEASTSGGGEPTWVEVRLGEAAGVLRSDIVRATAGPGCTFCAYATACPAQAEGAPVVP